MSCNKIKFISTNVRVIKNSDKRIKISEYFNTLKTQWILTECYSLNKRIPVKKMKKEE